MKRLNVLILIFAAAIISSCNSSSADQEANAQGFAAIEEDLKSEFGKDAYYTELVILYDASIGNSVSVTVTDDPESLKMGEWICTQGAWEQSSDITLEISEGAKAKDFMFQLDEKINLKTLGGLVETSQKKLTADKKIENPVLEMAFINFPDDGDFSKANYVIKLEPENGGTSFTYSYDLNGDFIEMSFH